MKPTKTVKESVTASNATYCPYCGRSNLSSYMGSYLCPSCGATFAAARLNDHSRFTTRIDENTKSLHLYSRQPVFPSAVRPTPTFLDIGEALSALGLPPNVGKAALDIYRRAFTREAACEGKLSRGMAPASVYAACKQNGLSISIKEIADAFNVDQTEAERSYTYLLNEMGFLTSPNDTTMEMPQFQSESLTDIERTDLHEPDVAKFLEKKGTYEFLRLLKEKPRRWKTLEKELALSPRTLSERISQALELGFIEKVRRLKIGATYYRLTKKGSDIFEAMTGSTKIY
jgi:DNA-binding HxlR family transcriptional regulator/ribosomal protein L37AE/L43A